MRQRIHHRRRGATTVEFAVTCPIVFFMIFATIVGALGVFRYQQTAELAREAARWASVHGGQYEQETGNAAATAQDIYTNAILPGATALNLSKLSYQVTWNTSNMPLDASESVGTPHGNTVSVTVTYQWFPEVYLIGPFNLSSTSTAQMIY
ncbi:MAG: TadE/TadG family type IV pilus assembly protein [Pirellulaceae bacterium]